MARNWLSWLLVHDEESKASGPVLERLQQSCALAQIEHERASRPRRETVRISVGPGRRISAAD